MTKNTKISTEEILAPFEFAAFRIMLKALDRLHLPSYKGSAIRGSFGHAFRQVTCPFNCKECGVCEFLEKCAYAYVFETRPSESDEFIRNRNDKVPHPYVIRPPLDARTEFNPGEILTFELILIGRAIDYLPYFAHTFVQMGECGLGRGRGKFMLKQIDSISPNGRQETVYHANESELRDKIIRINCRQLLEQYPIADLCTLKFLTRLEFKEKGKQPQIQFGNLFRRLLARVTTLAHLHCGIDCRGIDFKSLSHAADKVTTVSSSLYREAAVRYSNRQKRRMPFGGLLGEVTFEGFLSPFWPFILLGEWLHVGKKTAFGLGRYSLHV